MLKILRQLSYYLNATDPVIFALIFIFLSCHDEAHAHDNKEFSRENSKPRRESRITTR